MSTSTLAPVGDTEVIEMPSLEGAPDCGFPHNDPSWLAITETPCTHEVVARISFCVGSLLLCEVARDLAAELMSRNSMTKVGGKVALAMCGMCNKPVHECWRILPV